MQELSRVSLTIPLEVNVNKLYFLTYMAVADSMLVASLNIQIQGEAVSS